MTDNAPDHRVDHRTAHGSDPSLDTHLDTRAAPRQFDLIAFDWDGTLFDSTAIITRCIQEAVRDVGGTVPDARAASWVIGMSLADALAHAAPDVPASRHAELGARYRHHYQRHQADLSLFDGVLPLLSRLRARGHVLAVATGKSRRGLDELLARPALRGVLDASRTADETAGKPDPRMLRELMAQFGVAPARTLMVGDTTHDLELARRAGTASLAVAYGAHSHDDFASHAPLAVVHSVAELGDWLAAHG